MFFCVSLLHALRSSSTFSFFSHQKQDWEQGAYYCGSILSANSLLIAFDNLHNIHLYTYIYIISTYLMKTLNILFLLIVVSWPCVLVPYCYKLSSYVVSRLFVLLWYYRFWRPYLELPLRSCSYLFNIFN